MDTARSGRGLCALLAAAALCAAVLAPAAHGQRRDPASTVLAADLRDGPARDAPVLATLPAGTAVEVLEMRGDGARVAVHGREGWLPASRLRLGQPAAESSAAGGGASSWLRGLTGLLGGGGSGGTGSGADVPIGVRGLQREDVATAEPDPGAVQHMERYRAAPDEAIAFARDAGLQSFDYPYPQPDAAPAAGASADR